MKRIFDTIISLLALILLIPLFLFLIIWIIIDSHGGFFYVQKRVGKSGKDFGLLKFRTMYTGSDSKGLLTVGMEDPRITKPGKILRKYKMDELPQLLNVIAGQMSIVGPRPEVRKYVELYNDDQKKVLEVRPGLTDYASLMYMNENEILGSSPDPEYAYIHEIMPAKLELNLKYIREKSFTTDLRIIIKTIRGIISSKPD